MGASFLLVMCPRPMLQGGANLLLPEFCWTSTQTKQFISVRAKHARNSGM